MQPLRLSDYHTHTPLCKHAVGEPAEYVAAAAARGLDEIAFTDHVPAPDGYDAANRMLLEQYPEYLRRVRSAAGASGPAVLLGIEADYYEGCEPFLAEWLPRQPFDLVLGSVHYIDDWAFDNPDHAARWDRADLRAAWGAYFALVGRLADSGLFDIVGHLDLPKKFGHRPDPRDVEDAAAPALDRIARAGMAIEINTAGLRRPAREAYPSPLLLGLACRRGIPICFGSDAHAPGDVGHAFDQALRAARAAGYTHAARYRARVRTAVPLP
jgi:histidinol-phosphatase (PHP family)